MKLVAREDTLASFEPGCIPACGSPPSPRLRHNSGAVFEFATVKEWWAGCRRAVGGVMATNGICSLQMPHTHRRAAYGSPVKPPQHMRRSKRRTPKDRITIGEENAKRFTHFVALIVAGRTRECAAVGAGLSPATAYRWIQRLREQPRRNQAEVLAPQTHRCGRRSLAAKYVTDEMVFELQQLALELRSRAKAVRAWLRENADDCPADLRVALEANRLPAPLARATQLRRFACNVYEVESGVLAIHLPGRAGKRARVVYVEPEQR